ncbi:MAG TPA: DNA polymerase III subunit epsilon [Rhizomicrobium sp.]|jgi:DNA polymerase-3 subunit epsilon
MREIVLDTETTGLDPNDGHRVIEIGCVELYDHIPTGQVFQRYLSPERLVGDSERIHGISDEFLVGKPLFKEVAADFIDFIGDAPLVIHNASFDLKFLNHELHRLDRAPIPLGRAIDTLEIAKSKFPGARLSLDELCKRFAIDLSKRSKHGALLDAELTARVYLELIGGRQTRLLLNAGDSEAAIVVAEAAVARARPQPLAPRLSETEREAHNVFVTGELGKDAIWNWN